MVESPPSVISDERAAPWVVAAAALTLYLSLPSFRFNFDGIACAIAVELADIAHLLHGNHLLYGLFGLVFHRAANFIGIPANAAWSLQLMDSLFGAAGVGLFCRLLIRQKVPVWLAWIFAAALAVSHGWWLFSIDSQVYVFGAFFLIPAWDEALSNKPRPYRLALWNSMAVFGHVLNVFFAPAALYSLWKAHGNLSEKRTALMRYAIGSFLLVFLTYGASASLGMKIDSLEKLKVWLIGSAALGPGRSFLWYAPESLAQGLLQWTRSAGEVVCAYPVIGWLVWLAALASSFLGSIPRSLKVPLWLGILSYIPILLSYEPYSFDYRVTDLVPLWILAALGAARLAQNSPPYPYSAAFLIFLAAANMHGSLLAFMRERENRQYAKSLWSAQNLPRESWIAALALEEVYLPYFADIRTINLRYVEERRENLAARVAFLSAKNEPVFVFSDTLEKTGLAPFTGLRLNHAASFEEFELFRMTLSSEISEKESRTESGKKD